MEPVSFIRLRFRFLTQTETHINNLPTVMAPNLLYLKLDSA